MTVDREMCFDPLTQMNCNPNREPNPLLGNRTIFFAVQPRFQNVDIRLFLDVTKGGACWILFIHSFKDLYSTSSRKLLRGAPDYSTFKKNSFQVIVESFRKRPR